MEILLPRMKYTHEIVGTHGGALLPERAPGACSGLQNPSCVSAFKVLEIFENDSETKGHKKIVMKSHGI